MQRSLQLRCVSALCEGVPVQIQDMMHLAAKMLMPVMGGVTMSDPASYVAQQRCLEIS